MNKTEAVHVQQFLEQHVGFLTRGNIEKWINILTAYQDGECIQFHSLPGDRWYTIQDEPCFDYEVDLYRVGTDAFPTIPSMCWLRDLADGSESLVVIVVPDRTATTASGKTYTARDLRLKCLYSTDRIKWEKFES